MAVAALLDMLPPYRPPLQAQIQAVAMRDLVCMLALCSIACAVMLLTLHTMCIAATVGCGCHTLRNDDKAGTRCCTYVSAFTSGVLCLPESTIPNNGSARRTPDIQVLSETRASLSEAWGRTIHGPDHWYLGRLTLLLRRSFRAISAVVKPIQARASSHGHTRLRTNRNASARSGEYGATLSYQLSAPYSWHSKPVKGTCRA